MSRGNLAEVLPKRPPSLSLPPPWPLPPPSSFSGSVEDVVEGQ